MEVLTLRGCFEKKWTCLGVVGVLTGELEFFKAQEVFSGERGSFKKSWKFEEPWKF